MPVPEGIRLNVPGKFGENLRRFLAGQGQSGAAEAFRQFRREWSEHRALGEGGQVLGNEIHHQVAKATDVFWRPLPASPGLRGELQGCTLTHNLPPWLTC